MLFESLSFSCLDCFKWNSVSIKWASHSFCKSFCRTCAFTIFNLKTDKSIQIPLSFISVYHTIHFRWISLQWVKKIRNSRMGKKVKEIFLHPINSFLYNKLPSSHCEKCKIVIYTLRYLNQWYQLIEKFALVLIQNFWFSKNLTFAKVRFDLCVPNDWFTVHRWVADSLKKL